MFAATDHRLPGRRDAPCLRGLSELAQTELPASVRTPDSETSTRTREVWSPPTPEETPGLRPSWVLAEISRLELVHLESIARARPRQLARTHLTSRLLGKPDDPEFVASSKDAIPSEWPHNLTSFKLGLEVRQDVVTMDLLQTLLLSLPAHVRVMLDLVGGFSGIDRLVALCRPGVAVALTLTRGCGTHVEFLRDRLETLHIVHLDVDYFFAQVLAVCASFSRLRTLSLQLGSPLSGRPSKTSRYPPV